MKENTNMNAAVNGLLTGLNLGKPAVVEGLALIPVFGNHNCNIDYLTLDEAVKTGALKITEISEGGSVPNLKAENLSEKPVLLIDGEELIGAKQNRILNLSILLKEKSTTTIPVSCVEQGRWSYKSREFIPSMHVMPTKARALKAKTVSDNIQYSKVPASDQGLVWHEVSALHRKLGTNSPSAAMYDAFIQKKREIELFLYSMNSQPGQIGYLVFIGDKPQVLEIVPNPEKYKLYHTKFVAASVIDAIGDRLMNLPNCADFDYRNLTSGFINEILKCEEHEFQPVGYGINYRYQSKKVVGAALVHNDCVFHAVFFEIPDDDQFGERRFRGFIK